MLIHWIWLATRTGLNDRKRMALLERFQDAEGVFYATDRDCAALKCIDPDALDCLRNKSLTQAQEILDRCMEKGIHLLTMQDAAYPDRLKSIADPPAVLYYRGRLPDFDANPLIAVVGTRSASAYGLSAAKRMGYQIASCGGIVVSGMAYGIDGMAMRGALTAGGMVVGVLGCGADVVYPASNRALFADVEQYGCLLTEFPPGTPPAKWNFPKRNRIISGLSCGVLVVEAPAKSGALITAEQAAEQGRDVFVVPGNIDVASCAGSNALLREGAIAVSSGWDVVSEYQALYPGKLRHTMGGDRQVAYPDEVLRAHHRDRTPQSKVAQKPDVPEVLSAKSDAPDKKGIDNRPERTYSDSEMPEPELTGPEAAVFAQIRGDATPVDEVLAGCGVAAGTALAALTLLEVKGRIIRLPGRRVARKNQSS